MKDRLGVLDGLRGIAILQVVWLHEWQLGGLPAPVPWLQFIPRTGAYGVQLFFFLSGFVIVYPFLRRERAGERALSWAHFAWRRFIKIVPSYALSIVVAYAIGFAAMERTHSTVLQEIVTHVLFIHTWWTGTAASVNGVLWSLAIEAQFYAIFPLLWWCFKRQPWPTGLSLIALAWSLRNWRSLYSPAIATALSMNLPNFIDLFAYGMLSAWCFVFFSERLRHGRIRHAMPLVAFAGAAIVVVTLLAISEKHPWLPSVTNHELIGVAFSLLAIGALCSRGWTIALSNAPLRFFAIVSYNLYLWNWMIMHEMLRLPLGPVPFTAATICVCVAFATFVTYALERPLLRLPDPMWHAKRREEIETSPTLRS